MTASGLGTVSRIKINTVHGGEGKSLLEKRLANHALDQHVGIHRGANAVKIWSASV